MKKTIPPTCLITTPSKSYSVTIGQGSFQDSIKTIQKKHPRSKIAIVSETNLKAIYREQIEELLGQTTLVFYFKAGEASKQITTKVEIESFLFKNHFNRQDVLIALGGGVVGDLVGYVAATYMRGVAYYQIPTSLIAMVDSSVGGKTGINNSFGKNLVGAFHQPEGVMVDLQFLTTLPKEEYLNGMAEVIKYGLIQKSKIIQIIQTQTDSLLKKDFSLLIQLIHQSIEIKSYIVSQDEKETGLRKILNFGHTVGHAIEFASQYHLKHGFAISIGMALEAYISYEKGILPLQEFKTIISILKEMKLPVTLPDHFATSDLYQRMLQDKKNTFGASVPLTLIERMGKIQSDGGQYVHPISKDEFSRFAQNFRQLS